MAYRRTARLLFVIAAALSLGSVTLQASARQETASVYPEAVAIEDITYLGCVITTTEYAADKPESFDTVISETTEACPAGSVTRSFPTTVQEAEKLGLPYIALSGDKGADDAAVDELQASAKPIGVEIVEPQQFQSTCSWINRARSISYYAGYPDTGAGITSTVRYVRGDNCKWYISYVTDYVFDPLTAGQDIYWDELRYSGYVRWAAWSGDC